MVSIVRLLRLLKGTNSFKNSPDYWEGRYAKGGNSGRGSYGELANYKADVLNSFVSEHKVNSVLEFGCGDGNQLQLAKYAVYTGLDVSVSAIRHCMKRFETDRSKSFFLYNSLAYSDNNKTFIAELSLSLDVIYHLVEDEVYNAYMKHLFSSSSKYVIIYAWNVEGKPRAHVRHRKFSEWVSRNEPGWEIMRLENKIPRVKDACDFYFYKRS